MKRQQCKCWFYEVETGCRGIPHQSVCYIFGIVRYTAYMTLKIIAETEVQVKIHLQKFGAKESTQKDANFQVDSDQHVPVVVNVRIEKRHNIERKYV